MTGIAQRSGAGLSYLACGDDGGMPIVLLHGIGSNAQSFVPLMRAFEGRHPLLAWDAPGYGESQPLAIDWPDASDYATALNRLLSHLDVPRCILVGHSLGSLIAARFALVAARRVAALFLISPALGYGAEKGGALPPAVAGRIDELDRLGPEKFAAARAPGLLGDASAPSHVRQLVERSMAAVRRPGYDQAARLLAGGRLLDDAEKLDVATAVLVGSQDRITPPANARRLFDVLQTSAQPRVFREIAGAGHAICQEQPAEIARIITEIAENKARAHA
jgi:pimeloyl-ACP methyl ester carboxylesterase